MTTPKLTLIDWILLIGLLVGLFVGMLTWWQRNQKSVAKYQKTEIGSVKTINAPSEVWVDVVGAVENPGVYQLTTEARVKDAIVAAGGLSALADRTAVENEINMAEKIIDGMKIVVPSTASASPSSAVLAKETSKININKASQEELMSLWGVGEARAVQIIANRPYSNLEQLVEKKIVPKSVLDRNKAIMSLY